MAFSMKACCDISLADDDEMEQDTSFDLDKILGKRKRMLEKSDTQSKYIDIRFLPGGSIDVESLFSIASRIATSQRARLLPRTLEMVIFLKTNHRYWNVQTVHEAMQMEEQVGDLDEDALKLLEEDEGWDADL